MDNLIKDSSFISEGLTKDDLFVIYELLINKFSINEACLKSDEFQNKTYYSFNNKRLSRIISFIEKCLNEDF